MRNRTAIGLGLAACMVLGSMAGLVVVGLSPGPTDEPRRFTVPPSRVSDRWEELIRWRDHQDGDGRPTSATGTLRNLGSVLGLARLPDAALEMHDAVVVRVEEPAFRIVSEMAYDLTTRHSFTGRDWWYFQGSLGADVGSDLWFDPGTLDRTHFNVIRFAENHVYPWWPANHEGRTFHVGQDLTEEETTNLFRSKGGVVHMQQYDGPLRQEVTTATVRSWVGDLARIETAFGTFDAFSIVREHALRYDTVQEAAGGERRSSWEQTERAVFWYTEDQGLVRTDYEVRRWTPMGGATQPCLHWYHCVVNYTIVADHSPRKEGTQPIPWRSADPVYAPPLANPEAEHSGAQVRHPRGGTSTRLPYALNRALASIEADPSLSAFREWKSRHPDHAMVGMEYQFAARNEAGVTLPPPPTGPTAPGTWVFVYASPSARGSPEQAIVLSTTLQPDSGTPVSRVAGTASLGPGQQFRIEDLPLDPVTVDWVDHVWQALAPPAVSGPIPGNIHWGFVAQETQTAAAATVDDRDVMVRGTPVTWQTWKLSNIRPELDAARLPQQELNMSGMEVVIASGNVYYLVYHDMQKAHIVNGTFGYVAPAAGSPGTGAEPKVGTYQAIGIGGLATASLVSVLLVAYFLPLLKFVSAQGITALPLYAKLQRSALLDNKSRERLLLLIRQEPGITPPELHSHVGGGWTTTVYHLRVLEKNGLVSSLIDGRHKRFFPTDTIDWSKRTRLAVLRNERTRAVYDLILQDPGAIRARLAERIDVTPAAAAWHLERLERAGLVGGDKIGREMRYYPLSSREDPSPEIT